MTRQQHDSSLAAANRAEWKPDDYFRQVSLDEIFPKAAPLVLDLGCGDGSFLLEMARRHPEHNFLATERMLGRVEKVSRKIARSGFDNVRILRLESFYVLKWILPPGCASFIYVLHPDPWPKRQHHPRRLIQPEFMAAAHQALAAGGELRIKTDDKPYFQWMEKIFAQSAGFERLEWEEPSDWPQTDFERDFVAKGLPIYRARLRKV